MFKLIKNICLSVKLWFVRLTTKAQIKKLKRKNRSYSLTKFENINYTDYRSFKSSFIKKLLNDIDIKITKKELNFLDIGRIVDVLSFKEDFYLFEYKTKATDGKNNDVFYWLFDKNRISYRINDRKSCFLNSDKVQEVYLSKEERIDLILELKALNKRKF